MIWTEDALNFLETGTKIMQLSNYLCWSLRDFLQRIIISKDFKPQGPWSQQTTQILAMTDVHKRPSTSNHSPGSLHQYFRRKKRGCNSHCDKTVSMGRRCKSCLPPRDRRTESHHWDHSQGIRCLILCLTQEHPMFFILILKETHTYWLRVTTELKYNVCLLVWKALIFPPTGYFVSNTKWCLTRKEKKISGETLNLFPPSPEAPGTISRPRTFPLHCWSIWSSSLFLIIFSYILKFILNQI